MQNCMSLRKGSDYNPKNILCRVLRVTPSRFSQPSGLESDLQASIAYDTARGASGMGYPPRAVTVEQKILTALARIESKLDDTERRVKAIQQDLNRVKRIVRG